MQSEMDQLYFSRDKFRKHSPDGEDQVKIKSEREEDRLYDQQY